MNSPIIMIDPTGMAPMHIGVSKNDDGTYRVVGGEANSDKNVYLVDKNNERTGEVIGEMLTEYSFHNEYGTAVVGANINLADNSAQNFLNNEIKNVGLLDYIANAKGREPLDFKHRGLANIKEGTTPNQHHYRGMSFQGKIASARDVGNYAAGHVAGRHGFGWKSSRFAFDALQTIQEKGIIATAMLYPFNRVSEGQPTQRAERAGFNAGNSTFKERQFRREWNEVLNPALARPKW